MDILGKKLYIYDCMRKSLDFTGGTVGIEKTKQNTLMVHVRTLNVPNKRSHN